ncbi:MAG: hypothetical protein DJ555_07550 [Desulfurococcaceae archaeon]|nr:MAG: hypothetical protein DJ555_07550 [Desulfurococcaceae archaeon]
MQKDTRNIVLEFEWLGPLRRGRIAIKPLTILIGPNGSGKSYSAMLLYAINKALKDHLADILGSMISLAIKIRSGELKDKNEYYRNLYESAKNSLEKRLKENMVAIFTDLGSSINIDSDKLTANLRIDDHISYGFILKRDGSIVVDRYIDFEYFMGEVKKRGIDSMIDIVIGTRSYESLLSSTKETTDTLGKVSAIMGFFLFIGPTYLKNIFAPLEIVYLPATRSGLLQAHRVITNALVSAAPRLPLAGGQKASITGVSADFINTILYSEILYELSKASGLAIDKGILEAVEFLEKRVLGGVIDIVEREDNIVELVYKDLRGNLAIPVVAAASGVAELAPLALYLKKYVISPGTMLIFEEPEAHLHPKMQREIARLIAMLVNSGVWVLITTHSDLILEEFNILMRLSRMSEEERKKLGYKEYEYLDTNSVSAYLYKYDNNEKGYVAKELSITEDEGIPQDELTEVAFEMGETHAKITRMAELGERSV